jgi:hypothetical protein
MEYMEHIEHVCPQGATYQFCVGSMRGCLELDKQIMNTREGHSQVFDFTGKTVQETERENILPILSQLAGKNAAGYQSPKPEH